MLNLLLFVFENFKIIAIFTFIFALLLWHFKQRHFYYASWQLDGPICLPLLGNLLLFRNGRKRMYSNDNYYILFSYHIFATEKTLFIAVYLGVFETTKIILEKYKAPQRFWIGPLFMIVYITEPDDLQIILNHPNALPKPFVYTIAKEWLGEGLLTAPVPKWKIHRSFLQNTFNIKVLDSYISVYNECADILVKKLAPKVDLESFDIFSDVFMCALDIICGTFLFLYISKLLITHFIFFKCRNSS